MSVGALVTNERGMLGYIQEKILVLYVLIWDHEELVAGSIVML